MNYAECFSVVDHGEYAYGDLIDPLAQVGLSEDLGWTNGAYVIFTCEEPPVGRAARIDVGIHQFQDALTAQQALPFFSSMYASGENESRACDAATTMVICVSGRSFSGSPLSDVHFVLNQVLANAD